ncbi:hypothetical protein MSAN_01505600 [Mycena sanguinolenta]|uniref:DUF6532 domain-containing protein n=1 Tax=Mycena sanguinolenta TaxID=230812 RepID=A0A8H6Y7T4_9AGAR|nr:hypothetical protein MSAN_01505600 [Mycena sanguinolenta]
MQDSDDELSATSDEEENLTRAEKAKRTRALNLAQEEAANKKLTEETAGGRRAKNKALQDKVWDTLRNTNTSRKRAVSSSAEPVKTAKKTKANHHEEPDDMEVDEETPGSQAVVKNSSKTTRSKGSQGQDPQKAKGSGKEVQASTRRYQLTIDTESDEDSAAPQADVSSEPSGTNAATGKSVKAAPIRNKPTPKSKITETVDNEHENDDIPSQSEGEQVHSDPSQSEPEDGPVDVVREGAQIIERNSKQISSTADNSDSDPGDEDQQPRPRHCRQASLSSRGSLPPDTDLDFDLENDIDDDEVEDIGKKDTPEPVKKRKVSAQQLKYEQEKTAIRSLNVVQPSRKKHQAPTTVESDRDDTARIAFPKTAGQIKLLDQTPLLKTIIKAAIQLHLCDIAFKAGYESTVSRPAIVRRLMRLSAKKQPNGLHIEDRAKRDLAFCGYLAPLILTRGSNMRSGLRTSAISKVATHYELNKPGTTPSQVRSIVRQLLDQQRYIFPYAPTPTPRAGTSADAVLDSTDLPSMAADETDNAIGANATKKGIKSFVLGLPFHAPAIVDVIHEAWWSGGKALGSKYIDKLRSNRADRPEELVLPDAMICLAGANIWAALRAWETGRYVEAKEFSQERLENTYTSLQAVLETQRNGLSAKNFNKTMHELYKKVTQSNSSEAALGSANSVICLPIDID